MKDKNELIPIVLPEHLVNPDQANIMKDKNELIPTRASLLSRLKDWQDEISWKVFFDPYWKLIYNAALRAGLSDAEAQDVGRETVISVSKTIPDFQYKAAGRSFKGWLLQLTAWRIGDQFRNRQRKIRSAKRLADSTARTATAERVPDSAGSELEAVWD